MESLSGQNVHVARWGTQGPRVVLVHGSPQGTSAGGSEHFAAQKELARQGFQVIAPDRPGHGRSPAPGRPDDAQEDAKWVVELLGEGAHLVGHSFGACVALAAAAMAPAKVRSLTLIEPGMQMLAADDARVRPLLMRMLAAKFLSLGPAARARKFSAIVGIPPSMRQHTTHEELVRMGRAVFVLRIPSAADLRAQLATVRNEKIPLLVVSGGWSPAFEVVCDRVASLANGRRLVIPTPHHFPNLNGPRFNSELADFISSVEAQHAKAF